MLGALRQRGFARLWLASLLSYFGDWVLLIALPYYVYDLTGSALATGAMFMAYNVPRVLFASLGGVCADRWDRRRTLIVCDVSRGALVLLLLALQSAETLWIVYLVTFAQAAIGQFFGPARSALLPRLVGETELVAANSLDALTAGLTRLVGPPVGGALLALLGLASAVLVDAASFLVSAGLIALVVVPAGPDHPAPQPSRQPATPVWTSAWRDWLEGIQVVRREPVVVAVIASVGLEMVGYGAITVLLVAFARDTLAGGAVLYGWLATAQGIGTLAGGFAVGLAGRRLPPARLLPLSLGLAGGAFLAAFNAPAVPLVLPLVALAGVAIAGAMVSERTLLQESVADRLRGRVLGTHGATASLLILVGMGLASALGGPLGTVPTLSSASGVYLLAGAVGGLLLSRSASAGRSRATALT